MAEPGLADKVVRVHDALDAAPITHAFGGALALAYYAEIMRRACGFQLNAAFQRLVVKPVQHLFVFFRRDHLLSGNVHPTPYRH